MAPVPGRGLWSRRVSLALAIVSVALFSAAIAQFHRPRTGFTVLIEFGDRFDDHALPAVRSAGRFLEYNSPGYDGQFYAQLAVDPLLRDRAIDAALDNPPFRARRILFAWTAYVLGLGRPAWILQAYAVQNIIAWFLLAWLLTRWIPPTTPRRFAAWFGCLFGSGLAASITHALLDGPSLVVLTLAILAVEKGSVWSGAALMGLGGLGRETNLMAGGLVVDRIPRTAREMIRLAGMLAIMAAPYVCWSLYVKSLYPAFTFSNPDSFGFPFSGFIGKWTSSIADLGVRHWDFESRSCIYCLVSLTIQAGYILTSWQWKSPWWRMGVGYALFLPFLSSLTWDGYPGAAIRILVPMSLAFNVLIVQKTNRWSWLWIVLGNLSVLDGLHNLRVPFISEWL